MELVSAALWHESRRRVPKPFASGSGVPIKVRADGAFFGLGAGYDWQLSNRVVIGVSVGAPVATTATGRTVDPTFPATVY